MPRRPIGSAIQPLRRRSGFGCGWQHSASGDRRARSRSCTASWWMRSAGCRRTRFLHALNYCMLLPGPEAQQLATYIGWLLHRTLGGIMAGGLFIVPGILAIMGLSYIYAAYGNVGVVSA